MRECETCGAPMGEEGDEDSFAHCPRCGELATALRELNLGSAEPLVVEEEPPRSTIPGLNPVPEDDTLVDTVPVPGVARERGGEG